MDVSRAAQVWAPPTCHGLPECFWIQVLKDWDLPASGPRICAASAPAAKTRAASVPRPDPNPSPAPTLFQPRAPRLQGPSCLCPPLPLPILGFNLRRAAVKDPPTRVSSVFLSRSRFSAPRPPFSATLSSATALPALVRFWLGAPESPRHLWSLWGGRHRPK